MAQVTWWLAKWKVDEMVIDKLAADEKKLVDKLAS
jgi:hypothetical protein